MTTKKNKYEKQVQLIVTAKLEGVNSAKGRKELIRLLKYSLLDNLGWNTLYGNISTYQARELKQKSGTVMKILKNQ